MPSATVKPPKGKHGGPRPGAGRRPVFGDEVMVVVTANLSEAQRSRLVVLGGVQWLRSVLSLPQLPKLEARAGRGKDGQLKMVSFRLTAQQRDRFQAAGGSVWLRQVLNRSIAAAEILAMLDEPEQS